MDFAETMGELKKRFVWSLMPKSYKSSVSFSIEHHVKEINNYLIILGGSREVPRAIQSEIERYVFDHLQRVVRHYSDEAPRDLVNRLAEGARDLRAAYIERFSRETDLR